MFEVVAPAEGRDELFGSRRSRAARRPGGGGVIGEIGPLLRLELGIGLTPGCAQIPLQDREPEHDVIQHEEHRPHDQEQGDVLGRRCRAVEEEVDQARGEREAEVDVQRVGDGQ